MEKYRRTGFWPRNWARETVEPEAVGSVKSGAGWPTFRDFGG